jgi:hypothetical protein
VAAVGDVATTSPEARPGRLARALPLVLAALLAVAAVGTVGAAGCDDPGTYVSTPDGYTLVGGCVSPGKLDPMISDPTVADPAARRG